MPRATLIPKKHHDDRVASLLLNLDSQALLSTSICELSGKVRVWKVQRANFCPASHHLSAQTGDNEPTSTPRDSTPHHSSADPGTVTPHQP